MDLFDNSFIKFRNIKIFINGLPDNQFKYSKFLKDNNIHYIVKLCDETNKNTEFIKNLKLINFFELIYKDGYIPDNYIINKWLDIINDACLNNYNVFIHCLSGLGRAPLLVCILLIINTNEKKHLIIEKIRKIRKNALNKVQLNYFMNKKWKNKKSYCCQIQ